MSPFRKLWTTTVLNQRGGEAAFELTLIEIALAFGLTRKRLVNSVAEELEEKTVLYDSSKTRWFDAKSNEVKVLESRVLRSFKQWGVFEEVLQKQGSCSAVIHIQLKKTNNTDVQMHLKWKYIQWMTISETLHRELIVENKVNWK